MPFPLCSSVHKHYFQWEKLRNQEVTKTWDDYSEVQISHTYCEVFVPSLSCSESMLCYTGGSGISVTLSQNFFNA